MRQLPQPSVITRLYSIQTTLDMPNKTTGTPLYQRASKSLSHDGGLPPRTLPDAPLGSSSLQINTSVSSPRTRVEDPEQRRRCAVSTYNQNAWGTV
jgi:hypothetical protein